MHHGVHIIGLTRLKAEHSMPLPEGLERSKIGFEAKPSNESEKNKRKKMCGRKIRSARIPL